MPELQEKMHFKSTFTLGYQLPSSLVSVSKINQNWKARRKAIAMTSRSPLPYLKMPNLLIGSQDKVTQSKEMSLAGSPRSLQDQSMIVDSGQPTQDQQIGPEEASKQVLNSSGLLCKKNNFVNILHPGEGHLLPFTHRSNKFVYRTFYKRN